MNMIVPATPQTTATSKPASVSGRSRRAQAITSSATHSPANGTKVSLTPTRTIVAMVMAVAPMPRTRALSPAKTP